MKDLYFGWWEPADNSWEWHEFEYDSTGEKLPVIPKGSTGMVIFEKPRSSPARVPGFEPGELGSTPSGASRTIVCDNGCGVLGWIEEDTGLLGGSCPMCNDGNAIPGPVAQQDRALPSEGRHPGSTPGGASRKEKT